MSSSENELYAAAAALDALREEAAFAEAQHGAAHSQTLMRYHAQLEALFVQAAELVQESNDTKRSARDRHGLLEHAKDIDRHILKDVEMLRDSHRQVVQKHRPQGPGARRIFEAAAYRAKAQLEVWWDGKMQLAPLSAPAIAKRDWKQYRPLARWVPWAAGAGVAAAGAFPIISLFVR